MLLAYGYGTARGAYSTAASSTSAAGAGSTEPNYRSRRSEARYRSAVVVASWLAGAEDRSTTAPSTA